MSIEGMKINEKIKENNKIIEEIMRPNMFILNNTIAELLKENRELQEKCPHEYIDNYCIYCYKNKEEN